MLWYSIWLTLIVALTSLIMLRVVRRVGGASSRYMVAQQRSIAVEEGFVEEMMKGQKVVKVFTHEEAAMRDFDRINEQLYKDSERAHAFGNVLGPILANIGNFAYVLLAVIGGVLRALQVPISASAPSRRASPSSRPASFSPFWACPVSSRRRSTRRRSSIR